MHRRLYAPTPKMSPLASQTNDTTLSTLRPVPRSSSSTHSTYYPPPSLLPPSLPDAESGTNWISFHRLLPLPDGQAERHETPIRPPNTPPPHPSNLHNQGHRNSQLLSRHREDQTVSLSSTHERGPGVKIKMLFFNQPPPSSSNISGTKDLGSECALFCLLEGPKAFGGSSCPWERCTKYPGRDGRTGEVGRSMQNECQGGR